MGHSLTRQEQSGRDTQDHRRRLPTGGGPGGVSAGLRFEEWAEFPGGRASEHCAGPELRCDAAADSRGRARSAE